MRILHTTRLRRVGIVRARPRRSSTLGIVAVDYARKRPISSGNHKECTYGDNEDRPAHHELPLQVAFGRLSAPVVIQPHEPHWLERQQSSEQSTDQRDQAVEDRNSTGDNVRYYGHGHGATEPGSPVYDGTLGEVLGAGKQADEDVFGRQLVKFVS